MNRNKNQIFHNQDSFLNIKESRAIRQEKIKKQQVNRAKKSKEVDIKNLLRINESKKPKLEKVKNG